MELPIDLKKVERRILLMRNGVANMTTYDSRRPEAESELGWLHYILWELTGQEPNLQEALSFFRYAKQLQPREDASWAQNLGKVATRLYLQCQASLDCGKISQIISRLEEVSQICRNKEILFCWAKSVEHRYNKTHEVDDLRAVIVLLKEALAKIIEGGSDAKFKDDILESLSDNHQTLFKMDRTSTEGIASLQSAIEYSKKRLTSPGTRPKGTKRAAKLAQLSGALAQKFLLDFNKNTQDLDRSIQLADKAVTLSKGHRDQPVYLRALSMSYLWRYSRHNEPDDLDNAIANGLAAVQKVEEADNDLSGAEKALIFDAVSYALQAKFDTTGNIALLKQSIGRARQSVNISPLDDPERSDRLCTLVRQLIRQSQRRGGRASDIREAREWVEKGLETATKYPSQKPTILQCSSEISLHQLDVDQEQSTEMLSTAISIGQQALDLTRSGDDEIPSRLYTLGRLFGARYQKGANSNRNPKDLTKAITLLRDAVEKARREDQRRGNFIWAFSIYVLIDGPAHLPSDEKLDELCSLLEEAVHTKSMTSQLRIMAARRVAALWVMRDPKNGPSRARPVVEKAVSLLRRASSRVLAQDDQQNMLRSFQGLATLAAALALSTKHNQDDLHKALEILEIGRGVINANMADFRMDTAALSKVNGRLAGKFKLIRDQIYESRKVAGSLISSPGVATDPNKIHRLNDEFDMVVAEAQQLYPDLNLFMPNHSTDELKKAACHGWIVYINVSHCCDAILVSNQKVELLSLPNLSSEDIGEAIDLIRTLRVSNSRNGSKKFPQGLPSILEWLWDKAVGPILDALGFRTPPTDGDWPRVWWIPTGALTLLPLHAAGRRQAGSTDTALDRVVSSYSSSIKALISTRRNKEKKAK
jgi:hypothetical protein